MILPDLLTVEEAARLIRVGRTKAYAMAREWRETGGRSGLPVVDFGHVLRVPRHVLEGLVGAELHGPSVSEPDVVIAETSHRPESKQPITNAASEEPTAPRAVLKMTRSRRRGRRPVDPASQPTLPFAG